MGGANTLAGRASLDPPQGARHQAVGLAQHLARHLASDALDAPMGAGGSVRSVICK
jgi:hypothetical protein